MTDNIEKLMENLPITDIKHFVVTKDADGNEVRTEVTEAQAKADSANDVI